MGVVCASEAQTAAAKRHKPEDLSKKHGSTSRTPITETAPLSLGKKMSAFPDDSSGIEFKSKWSAGISQESILSQYEFDRVVGQGFTGKVRLATFKDDQSMVFAVKSISRLQGDDKEGKFFYAESNVLKELDHPNIIKFYECYQDAKSYHLVLELCEGSDLVKLVEKKRGLSEGLIKKFFFQAVSAVNHLQHIGVCHRDIKLDNFLLTNQDENEADLKLIDFGFTAIYRGKQLTSLVGTPWYVAPEILDKSKPYTYLCDNWSLGIVLYMMIFAKPPFMGRNHAELYSQIANKHIDFSEPLFQKLPLELLKILKGLLTKDPAKRLTLPQVLQSPWFVSHKAQTQSVWSSAEADHILQRLRDRQKPTAFERVFCHQMVKLFPDCDEVREAQRYFACCDSQGKGFLDAADIQRVGLMAGAELSSLDIQEILEVWSCKEGFVGGISYTEFIAGKLSKHFFTNSDRLKMTFERFDIDKSGFITAGALVRYFRRLGYSISEATASSMLAEVTDGSNTVSQETLAERFQQSDGCSTPQDLSFYHTYLDSSSSR